MSIRSSVGSGALLVSWLSLLVLWSVGAQEARKRTYVPANFSLRHHELPKWFDDAKLGVFIHWGLYSVPGWAPARGELSKVIPSLGWAYNPYAEWYANTMRLKDSPTWKHHVETYGADFDYYQFADTFNREIRKWDPKMWARLFRELGARYVVLTTKHHDGFALWPSKLSNPHLPRDRQHASRDLVGQLTEAVRAEGLRMGLYYSGGLDWSFLPGPIRSGAGILQNVPQNLDYARYADSHWRELIESYRPAILWNDISYPRRGEALEIFADYYNRYPDGVVNNRWEQPHFDFTTPEYQQYDKIVDKKWESCRGLGFSFGINRAESNEHIIAPGKLVALLVDIVSKNGNLLLNIGPEPDGTIPPLQLSRLLELGKWLETNGEAIFETRPWVTAEGKTKEGQTIRFTQKADTVYAILLDRPGASVRIEGLIPAEGMNVQLLGSAGDLRWERSDNDLNVLLPGSLPISHAFALKMTPKPYKVLR